MRVRDTAFTFAIAVTFGLAACQQNGATGATARGLDVPFATTNTATLPALDAAAMNATTAADVTFASPETTAQTFAPTTFTPDAGATANTNAPATNLRDGGSIVRDVAMVPGDVVVVGDAGIANTTTAAQGAANPNVVYVPVPVPVSVPVFGNSNSVPSGNVPTTQTPTHVPTTPPLGSTGTNLNGTIPGGPVGATPGVPPSAPPGAFPPPPAVPPSAVPPSAMPPTPSVPMMPSAPPGAFGIPAPPVIPVPR